jgi:hypothetical protein
MYGTWYLQKVMGRNFFYKNLFFVGILKVIDESSRIRIQDPDPDPLVRSMDPDPHQNVMDPQHCPELYPVTSVADSGPNPDP